MQKIYTNKQGNVLIDEHDDKLQYQFYSPIDDENYYCIEAIESNNPLLDLSNTLFTLLETNELIVYTAVGRVNILKDGDNCISDGYFYVDGQDLSIDNQTGTLGFNNLIIELYNMIEDYVVNNA